MLFKAINQPRSTIKLMYMSIYHGIFLIQTWYDVPDQVWNIAHIPTSWMNTRTEIFHNVDEVRESMSWNVKIGGFLGFFSSSKTYASTREIFTNSSSHIAEVTASVSSRKVDFRPRWALNFSEDARQYVDKILPSKLDTEDDIKKYKEFIKYFGTHYFTSGKFGGVIRVDFLTKSDFFRYFSSKDVKLAAQMSFAKIFNTSSLSVEFGYESSNYDLYNNFSMLSTHFTR